jgi:adenylate kinase family enzyme
MSYKNNKDNISEGSQNPSESLKEKLEKLIDKVPDVFRDLIEESYEHKRVPKEYLLTSILYAISSAVGKTFYTKELNYINYPNCYFIIVGSRGDAKTEALKIANKPIIDFDNESYEVFNDSRGDNTENNKVPRKQILIQNATIEKAQLTHYHNLGGVGLFYDEIRAIVQKMNNPNSRDGHDWEVLLLEAFTNGILDVSRKTTDTFRITKTYLTMLGGIQHQFIPDLFSKGLVGSGLIDRLLFTNKITSNSTVSRKKIDDCVFERYNATIRNLLEYKKQSEDPEEEVREHRIYYTQEAEDLLFDYTQKFEDEKINAESPLTEYYSKLIIYLHKLIIICFLMKHTEERTFKSKIDKETVLLAVDMVEFYLLNFKTLISNHDTTGVDKNDIINLAKKNEAPQKSVGHVLGLSKGQVSKLWNKA